MKIAAILTIAIVGFAPALRAAEPAELIRLYEEEILAHDLYVALAQEHPGIMPLKNIPRSEAMHKEMMAKVLEAEEIEMPSPKKKRRFVTPGLDKTYKRWFKEGKKSAADACRVGVRLEEHDIMDLRKAQTSFPAHKEVLEQLESASNNHLRAFHRNMVSRGGTYQVEVMSEKDLASILDGSNSGGCGGCGNCASECDAEEKPDKQVEETETPATAQPQGRGPRNGRGPGNGMGRGRGNGQGNGQGRGRGNGANSE